MKIATIALASVAYLASLIPTADAVDYMDQALAAHNSARAQYGAAPLTWNTALTTGVGQVVHSCVVNRTSGPYGENLYTTPNLTGGIDEAMSVWMAEASKYDYNRAQGSYATSNFTQVVWQNTTRMACAQFQCPAGTILRQQAALYTVCRYTLSGNVDGQYAKNVGHHV